MVNIDTVYQKVLAIANKEQRGYITPQEFNLFADQAQKEILDQYFYDINQFGRLPGNDTEYSDMLDLLNEKLSVLEIRLTSQNVAGGIYDYRTSLGDVYRIGSIMVSGGIEIEEVNNNEYYNLRSSPLTQPNLTRPIYVNRADGLNIYPDSINSIDISYTKTPDTPRWGYVVVNGYAQHNGGNSTDFELHPSEENNLILKILQLSGLVMKDVGLYQAAAQEETKDIQQEKQ
jgi:hypothetical protein